MKVSIVTISFNQGAFLECALRSVLDQSYPEIEYIVVDPGSTDGSRDILERYRPRLTKLILNPDRGPADGLNRGLAEATGEIFAYLNSDDELLPGAIQEAVDAFKQHPQADVIYGHGLKIDASGRTVRRLRSAPWNLRRAIFGSSVLIQQATFFRRSAVHAVGGFNAAAQCCWDYELLVDLALRGARFYRVDRYWGSFRNQDHSISNALSFQEMWQPLENRVFEKVMGRPHRWYDLIQFPIARLVKWTLDPKSFAIAGIERLRLGAIQLKRRLCRQETTSSGLTPIATAR